MVRMLHVGIAGAGLLVGGSSLAAVPSPLIVRRQAGLERVVVWYPTGELRALAFEPEEDAFIGLPPARFATRPNGRVEIFKHFSDGSVSATHAWALGDGAELVGFLLCDPAEELMWVELDVWGDAVAGLTVANAGGSRLPLHRVRNSWHLDVVELDESFELELEWRDGRQRRWSAVWRAAQLSLRLGVPAYRGPPPLRPVTTLELGDRQLQLGDSGLAIASSEVTAWLELGSGRLLVGTAGGDLLDLRLDGDRVQSGRYLDGGRWQQPVVGLVRRREGQVLVGVLGDGLWQLVEGRLHRSPLYLGTRMITALAVHDDQLWIGTATAGLWRFARGRLERAAYPVTHVTAISGGAPLVVEGGAGRWTFGDGEWRRLDRGVKVGTSEPEWTGTVDFEGVALVGSREHGLFARRGQALEAVDLDLTPSERQIRALAVWQDELWLATRAGLLVVSRDSCGVTVSRRHQAQVLALGVGAAGLWVVSAVGRYLVDPEGELRWLDRQAVDPTFAVQHEATPAWLTAATGT